MRRVLDRMIGLILLNHLKLPSPELYSILNNSLKRTLLQPNSVNFIKSNFSLGNSRYIASERTSRKTPYSIVPCCFMRVYCLVIEVLLLRALAPMGTCSQSRCLALGLYVTIFWETKSKVSCDPRVAFWTAMF
jgi:hypothetical protein